jgi:hypothetical protein
MQSYKNQFLQFSARNYLFGTNLRAVQCVRKVAVHLEMVLEVTSTRVYTGLNLLFKFIRKHFLQICLRKVAVHLEMVLEVTSTRVYTGLNLNLPWPKCTATFRTHSITLQPDRE